jgi:hypothetical protein
VETRRRRGRTKGHSLKLVAVFLVLVAALTAGCGGGDDGALSESEFREEANAVCEGTLREAEAIEAPASPEEIPDYVDRLVPLVRQGLERLRALQPPADLQEDYDQMLDETETALASADDLATAAQEGDPGKLQEALAAGDAANQASDRLATKLGLDECAAE